MACVIFPSLLWESAFKFSSEFLPCHMVTHFGGCAAVIITIFIIILIVRMCNSCSRNKCSECIHLHSHFGFLFYLLALWFFPLCFFRHPKSYSFHPFPPVSLFLLCIAHRVVSHFVNVSFVILLLFYGVYLHRFLPSMLLCFMPFIASGARMVEKLF